jgi:hypothetical protein
MVITCTFKKNMKTKKCECGRKILSVRTIKKSRSKAEVSPKKTSVRATIRALTPLSRRADSIDDDSCSKTTVQTESTSSTGEKVLCLKCKMKTGELQTNLPEPKSKKKKRPIIERLRVIKASTSSLSDQSRKRKCRSSRCNRIVGPLPNEVYIEQQHSDEYVTESTALGFDGISPSSTLTKRVPTRFTFDDVVPSNSSFETEASDSGALDQRGSAILTDLKVSENGGPAKDSQFHELSSKYAVQPQRERTVTASTIFSEMDIELSESDFHKAAGMDEKLKIFSPSNHDHGDSEQSDGKNATESGKDRPAFGWLFDFSFLAIK